MTRRAKRFEQCLEKGVEHLTGHAVRKRTGGAHAPGAETTKAQKALLEITVEGCAPYAQGTACPAAGSDFDDDDDNAHALLPDPVVHALRWVLLQCLALFQTYVAPHVPPGLRAPFSPASADEALRRARAEVRALEGFGRGSPAVYRDWDAVAQEIAAIEAALDRIEVQCRRA
jgi:hypothetical protein